MRTILYFLIHLHINYIQEEWEILNPIGRFIIKPFWFIRCVFIYILSPIIFIGYLFNNSKIVKQINNEFNIFNKQYQQNLK